MEISPVSFGCKYVVKSKAPRRMVQTASQKKVAISNFIKLKANSLKTGKMWLQQFVPGYTKQQNTNPFKIA